MDKVEKRERKRKDIHTHIKREGVKERDEKIEREKKR